MLNVKLKKINTVIFWKMMFIMEWCNAKFKSSLCSLVLSQLNSSVLVIKSSKPGTIVHSLKNITENFYLSALSVYISTKTNANLKHIVKDAKLDVLQVMKFTETTKYQFLNSMQNKKKFILRIWVILLDSF